MAYCQFDLTGTNCTAGCKSVTWSVGSFETKALKG